MKPLSARVTSLWAKSTEAGSGYSLLGHLLDVCAVTYVLLGREPERTLEQYSEDLGLEPEVARRWVAALVGLHDIGKATPAFQCLWAEGKEAVMAAGLAFGNSYGKIKHGVFSQRILGSELISRGFATALAEHVADAVSAHHGYRHDVMQLRQVIQDDLGKQPWGEAREELLMSYFAALGLEAAFPPAAATLSGQAFVRLAGLTTFADWIGSTVDHFSTSRQVVDPTDHYRHAIDLAERALDSIGWVRRTSLLPAGTTFKGLFPGFDPNELQRATIELVAETSSPSLFIIEAPMGKGKTEAAFYIHAALQERLGHRGMYVALPSQATGNAMFERTKEFLAQTGRSEPPDLQLLHGASLLNDSFAKIQVKGIDGVNNLDANVWARSWFTSNKRGLLSEYGVGTVDQALLGVLNIKHQPLRLWGLGNRTVVIDEVHAYELYTSRLIEVLLEWLQSMGSTVILLSATLPSATRRRLVRKFKGTEEAVDVPYPRITSVQAGRVTAHGFSAGRPQRVAVQRAPLTVDELAPLVGGLTAQGGCAVAILNTVQRAQDLYVALGEGTEITGGKRLADGTEVYLFHARYPADERQQREVGVLEKFGKDGVRPQRAILIATQVVEQSLDLDFDVMVSDLAPIDLLIQRIGRMHRHARAARPPLHVNPVVYVAGLTPKDEPPDVKSVYFDKVYEAHVLYLTWLTLADRQEITIPSEIETLVEEVYGEGRDLQTSDEIKELIAEALAKKKQGESEQASAAGSPLVSIRSPSLFATSDGVHRAVLNEDDDDPAVHDQLRPTTRLGRQRVVVIPLHKSGKRIFLEPELRTPVSLEDEPTWDLAKQVYLRHIKLSQWEVIREYVARGQTPAWRKHPLLRYALPLVFEDGEVTIGTLQIGLDRHLGVTYTRSP